MTSPQTDPRVRRLHRRPWSRSLATALGGGFLIDAYPLGSRCAATPTTKARLLRRAFDAQGAP